MRANQAMRNINKVIKLGCSENIPHTFLMKIALLLVNSLKRSMHLKTFLNVTLRQLPRVIKFVHPFYKQIFFLPTYTTIGYLDAKCYEIKMLIQATLAISDLAICELINHE